MSLPRSRTTTPSPRFGRRPPFLTQPSVISWQSDPSRPPRYFVLHPNHIVTLTHEKKSLGVRLAQKFKEFSQKWFSHVLLLGFLLAYAAMGALLFEYIEGPFEARQKQSIKDSRNYIIKDLHLTYHTMPLLAWKRQIYKRLREYEVQIRVIEEEARIYSDSEKTVWTFWGAMFYCGTVFTTIGYGNIAPSTSAGMAVTIVYAFIGIPLLLMVLADLGKLFTKAIKWMFFAVKHFYKTGRCRSRRTEEKSGDAPVQYVAFVWKKVNDTMAYVPYPAMMKSKKDSDKSPTSERDIEFAAADEAKSTMSYEEEEEIDDEFNLPISLALILLTLYMTIGACIFTIWEPWTFFEAYYFVFISMSTIGFGDFVPEHPMFMMATFIYLLFGLALTSMCINVVQEKLSATFQKAKMQIGTTLGFDPSMLEEEEPEKPDEHDKERRGSKDRRGSKAPIANRSVTIKDDLNGPANGTLNKT